MSQTLREKKLLMDPQNDNGLPAVRCLLCRFDSVVFRISG